jgi:hypothetical protein
MFKKLLFTFVVILSGVLTSCSTTSRLKSAHLSDVQYLMQKRMAIFDAFITEIDRIDSDRFLLLKNKGINWLQVSQDLRAEIDRAKSPFDVGAVFKKLDALYPHIQSQYFLNPDLDQIPLGSKLFLPLRITPMIDDPNQQHFKFYISNVKVESFAGAQAPIEGDQILEINKKSILDWESENFIFCKYSSRTLCALELGHNLRGEILSWNHLSPLVFLVQRGPQKIVINVKSNIQSGGVLDSSDTSSDSYNESLACGIDAKKRYPAFGYRYKGRKLCLLESHSHPGVAILRISSFNYFGNESIRTLKQEVEIFSKFYWDEHSGEIKNLIIDIMDNEGGEAPINYYSILFNKPFEDEYIKYKKIKEWNDPGFDESLFTGDSDGGKMIWMKSLKEDGLYNKIEIGSFFEPIPRACVNSKLDCRVGRFEPAEHRFTGDVHVMLNQFCSLGCSSFAATLERNLGSRVSFYGLPDSADPAAALLELKMTLTPSGPNPVDFRTQLWTSATPALSPDLLMTQSLAFSIPTDKAGISEAGVSRKITQMAKLTYKNYPTSYATDTLKTVLSNLKKK